MSSPGMFLKPNSLSIPINTFRSRSGSSSSLRGVRAISRDRPGTPRPSMSDTEPFEFSTNSGTHGSRLGNYQQTRSMSSIGSWDPLNHSFKGSSGNLLSPRPNPMMRDLSPRSPLSQSFSAGVIQYIKALGMNLEVEKKFAMTEMLNEELVQKLEYYSNFTPTSVSMNQFFEHGDNGNGIEESLFFLRREIPVRLANIMKELELLPSQLLAQPKCQDILRQYCQTFTEVLKFEKCEANAKTHEDFNKLLTDIRQRHQDTVAHMAEALHILKDEGILQVISKDKLNQAIQYFLDRLYMSRISINMLISQHKALYCPEESKNKRNGLKGTIDPKCNAVNVARSAFNNATFLCEQIYMDAPKLNIECVDVTGTENGQGHVQFKYIPDHLYHMMFEVFKNSMRATMEFHESSECIPDIDVKIVKSVEDISIKICDQGGGISRSISEKIFMYLYTSAARVKLSEGDMGGTTSTRTPMHGLGYGLPLSRLYARYFGGDIKVSSCDGYGTDTYIYLRALESDARESLPIFNLSSSNKLRDTQNQVDDWTKVE